MKFLISFNESNVKDCGILLLDIPLSRDFFAGESANIHPAARYHILNSSATLS